MIEKILKEINRLKKELDGYSALEALDYIEAYINTLPEKHNEDLEEAARYYLLNNHISPLNNILHQANLKVEMQYHKDIEDTYKAGAEWQKQQMMKDAVEAEIMYPASSSTLQIRYKLPKNTKLKYGDKVKIIILKTE